MLVNPLYSALTMVSAPPAQMDDGNNPEKLFFAILIVSRTLLFPTPKIRDDMASEMIS
jgi:hypothetical protein